MRVIDLEQLNLIFAPDSFEGLDGTEDRSELGIRGVTYDSAAKRVGIVFENGEQASQSLEYDQEMEGEKVYKAVELPNEWTHNGISHVMLISHPTRGKPKVLVISTDLSKISCCAHQGLPLISPPNTHGHAIRPQRPRH